MATALKITAKRNGFRRGGIAHADTPVLHPRNKFSKEQLEQILNEPMLVVEEVDAKEAGGKAEDNTGGDKLPTKKADLQAWLTERKVEFSDEDTVAQLTERAEAHLKDGQKEEE